MKKRARTPTRLGIEQPKPLPDAPYTSAAVKFSMNDRWSEHPGHGLTPRHIRAILLEAELGFPSRQCDLFDDTIEADAHLRSLLEARVEAVAGKAWIMQPGGDDPADELAAKRLEEALRAVPGIANFITHQLKANWYGYSASAITWEFAADGFLVPVWFANVPHRRVRFVEDDEPRLLTDEHRLEGVPFAPGSWVLHRRPGRLCVKEGLLRTLIWWSFIKRQALRDWAVFCERFGMPYILGKYKMQSSADSRKALRQAVASLGSDGGAIMEDTCEIELKTAPGGAADNVQGALVAVCNNEMSKLITGATLTTDTGSAGSYAQSRVHENRGFDLTLADAERLALLVEQDICVPFMKFNGLPGKPPRLKVHVVREVDPLTRAQVLDILVNKLGLELDADQVRQEFQAKPPAGEALKRAPVAPPANQPSGAPPSEKP